MDWLVRRLVGHISNRLLGQSVGRSFCQRAANKLVGQSVGRSVGQMAAQLIGWTVSWILVRRAD